MTELTALNRLILAVTLSIPLICFATAVVIWGAYWLLERARQRRLAKWQREQVKRDMAAMIDVRIAHNKASDLPTDDQWFDALQAGRFHAKEPRNASH